MPVYALKTRPQETDWESMLSVWRAADEIDLFQSAWNFDHLYPTRGPLDRPVFEAWVTLSALAQATTRLKIGCMVHGMHFRHPAITAKMAASLDQVSGGRLLLGLGAGWFEAETDAYGIDLGTVKQRFDRFDEGLEVIVSLLTQHTSTFSGEYYQLRDAHCEPKPLQQPHPPIMIGGVGERRTLKSVARWAQMWDALLIEPDEWPTKHDVLMSHCEEIGRDPAEITTSAHVLYNHDTPLEQVVDRAARLAAVGLDMVVITLGPPFHPATVETLAQALVES